MNYSEEWVNFERMKISESDYLINVVEIPVYENVLLDSKALMRG